mmetsp:Transcript_48574/g.77292  ORF Transcript_48574/g.77292 Transcript_48574/m.77292 type:complete len:205 (-) Transcript_48574:724-1338(-)
MVLQVQTECGLHCTAPRDHGIGLQGATHGAKGVVHRSGRFFQHEFIGTSNQDAACLAGGAALDEDEVVVAHAFVHHLLGAAHVAGIESLLAVIRGHGEKHLGTSDLGDSLDVLLVDTSNAQNTSLHQVLHGEVIDAFGGEDGIDPSIQNPLDLLLGDVHLLLPDPFQLFGIVDDDVHVHRHAVLLEVKIQQCNLGGRNPSWHFL